MTSNLEKDIFPEPPSRPNRRGGRKDIFLVSPSFFFNTRLTFKTVAAFAGMTKMCSPKLIML